MGKGNGGYTEKVNGRKSKVYKDSGGKKVTDQGTILVAEHYIDMGYEVVFRRRHLEKQGRRSIDLTIKSSDDTETVKNIEVKRVESPNPSQMASKIKIGFRQFLPGEEDTIAVYLPYHSSNAEGRAFAQAGFAEAMRKGNVRGKVEVWFNDKEKMEMN